MNMKAIRHLTILMMLLLVAGCAAPPVAGPPASPGADGLPARPAVDAQATLAMWGAQQTAIAGQATAQAQATQSMLDATATTQTANDMATATRIAQDNATATAIIFQVTVDASYLQLTRDAYAIDQQRRLDERNDEISRVEIEAASTSVAQEAQARDQELERQGAINAILPWALGTGILVVVAIIVWTMLLIWRRLQPYVIIEAPEERPQTLLIKREYATLTGRTDAIEASSQLMLPQLEADETALLPTPRWDAFNAWRDSWRVPIGTDASRKPIFLDRRVNPHVAILGTTGKGKTQSGLWPITSAYLGMGINVVIANGRGADFNHFQGHPNAHVLPAVAYEDGPDQLAELLAAIDAEMNRRDRVLAESGALRWSDLENMLDQPSELALVIDEFTSLATRANADAAKEMWHSLQRLTHEARKYGIYAVFTMTDQTRRAIGGPGATVINQCVRIAFGVQSPAMARSFIESEDAVGLAPGQFVATVGGGRPVRGAAFHPAPDDVVAYLKARPVQAQPLPAAVARAVEGEYREVDPVVEGDLLASIDAEELRHVDREALTSLNKVARFLTGKDGNANADEYRRAARALILLADEANDLWARQLLEASSSDVVGELMRASRIRTTSS